MGDREIGSEVWRTEGRVVVTHGLANAVKLELEHTEKRRVGLGVPPVAY